MLGMSATAPSAASSNRPATRASHKPAMLTAVAWVPERDMDIGEWSHAGQQLGVMNRCSPWWLGDWIRYGNTRFGEKYSLAAKITVYDPQTLMNMVYVASHFDEISRRREILSWSHHEAVASLDPEMQDHWLDEAIKQKMSVADIRLELRSRQRGRRDAPEGDANGAGEQERATIGCPHCGQPVPYSLFLEKLKSGARAKDPDTENGRRPITSSE
jgi:hypothetical protein